MFFYIITCRSVIAQDVNILEKNCHLDISVSRNNIHIKEQNYVSKRFLNNINQNTKDAVFYSSFDPIVKFEAWTEIPQQNDKSKIIKVVTDEEKSVLQRGIFYNDYIRKEFIYPAVVKNSIGVLKYSQEIKDPHFINTYFFDDQYNVDKSSFSITTPISVKIEFSIFNTDEYDVKFTQDTIKKTVKYTWEINNLKKLEHSSKSPPRAYYAPHIIARINSYKFKGTDITVSSSVDDLFKWYNSLINKIPKSENENELKLKVNELTKNSTSETEKIKLIYKWVQSNIKYIAFEDGLGGFIPRAAGDVFAKKYGDCKDMANLLKTMLNLADIPAFFTWIGTIAIPYSYYEVPSINSDNHMICAIKDNNNFIFLDATNPFIEYGTYPYTIQGKEALVRLSDEEYKIIKLPISDFKNNTRIDSVNLSIKDEILYGKAKVEIEGYIKDGYYFQKLRSKIDNEENFIQDFLSIGKKSSVYKNTNVDEEDLKVTINFYAEFKNEIIYVGDKMYVNLNLDPTFNEMKIKDIDKRTVPIFEQFKNKCLYQCNLSIPEGYKVDFIPENITFEFDNFQIKTTYSKTEDKITYQKEIISDFLFLYKNRFADYKAFLEAILKINEQKIILKKY
ncbi:MAG: hypothetical protein A2033_11240 [Bacteroidetes bacterium GWA2_31_9]|nr:MAG: hypothetical protein A2033_11240 [Bacteroidetes bacterium GWA2_31_9]